MKILALTIFPILALTGCLTQRTVSRDGKVEEQKMIIKVPGEEVLKNTFENDSAIVR